MRRVLAQQVQFLDLDEILLMRSAGMRTVDAQGGDAPARPCHHDARRESGRQVRPNHLPVGTFRPSFFAI